MSVEGIVDAIDALVDEQLADGPQDDYNADRYDKCWHCGRHWHGLPITERIAEMYQLGDFDETYSVADDDSRILCRGSDFIGPMPPERDDGWSTVDGWRLPTDPFDPRDWNIPERMRWGCQRATWTILTTPDNRRWWRLPRVPADSRLESNRTVGDANATITLTIGDARAQWPAGRVRIEQSESGDRATIDVLTENAPNFGGTWEPLTAPGSICHPADGPTWISLDDLQAYLLSLFDQEETSD